MEPLADDGTRTWDEPGIYEVAPGVHRIPLPLPNDGLRAVNVYAVNDETGLVMIDSGWALAEAREQLQAALKGIGAELGDISQFLVTHVHRDHYTQAVALRREFGMKIALGQQEEYSLQVTLDPDREATNTHLRLMRESGAEPVVRMLEKIFAEG